MKACSRDIGKHCEDEPRGEGRGELNLLVIIMYLMLAQETVEPCYGYFIQTIGFIVFKAMDRSI